MKFEPHILHSNSTYCSVMENLKKKSNRSKVSGVFNKNLLQKIHDDILKHFEGITLLNKIKIRYYLRHLSKLNLECYKDEHLATNAKKSLVKIYKSYDSFEKSFSAEETLKPSYCISNFHSTDSPKLTENGKFQLPFNISSEYDTFNSDMLSNNNFIGSTSNELSDDNEEKYFKESNFITSVRNNILDEKLIIEKQNLDIISETPEYLSPKKTYDVKFKKPLVGFIEKQNKICNLLDKSGNDCKFSPLIISESYDYENSIQMYEKTPAVSNDSYINKSQNSIGEKRSNADDIVKVVINNHRTLKDIIKLLLKDVSNNMKCLINSNSPFSKVNLQQKWSERNDSNFEIHIIYDQVSNKNLLEENVIKHKTTKKGNRICNYSSVEKISPCFSPSDCATNNDGCVYNNHFEEKLGQLKNFLTDKSTQKGVKFLDNIFTKAAGQLLNIDRPIMTKICRNLSFARKHFREGADDIGKGHKTYFQVHEHLEHEAEMMEQTVLCLSHMLNKISLHDNFSKDELWSNLEIERFSSDHKTKLLYWRELLSHYLKQIEEMTPYFENRFLSQGALHQNVCYSWTEISVCIEDIFKTDK